ncbi:UNVERIFIED_CONTAM: hypothetical protein K2H54_062917 [Gekko kuhli]
MDLIQHSSTRLEPDVMQWSGRQAGYIQNHATESSSKSQARVMLPEGLSREHSQGGPRTTPNQGFTKSKLAQGCTGEAGPGAVVTESSRAPWYIHNKQIPRAGFTGIH